MTDKVMILRSTVAYEVEVLKTKLDESGIPNWVVNKQDSSYMTFGDIELYVDASDVEIAKKLIEVKK